MFKKIYEGLYTDLMLKISTLKKAGVKEYALRIQPSARPSWWELHVEDNMCEQAEKALGLLHLEE